MGVPLMIQEKDMQRIDHLMKDLGVNKKIDIVRSALTLLEKEAVRLRRVKRWKRAARLVAKTSADINKEFQTHSRIKSK